MVSGRGRFESTSSTSPLTPAKTESVSLLILSALPEDTLSAGGEAVLSRKLA